MAEPAGKINGRFIPRLGHCASLLFKIFANPVVSGIDVYYEPVTYDYQSAAQR